MQRHAHLPDADADSSEPTLASLQSELAETRRRLAEAEQTLHAIRRGEVDAIITQGAAGPQADTLKAAGEPYRQIVEQMPGASLKARHDADVQATGIYGDDAELTGFSIIATEMSERKQMAAALAKSEAEFRALFEHAAVGQAQLDASTRRFIRVNPKICEMTGYSAEELAEMTPADITFAEDRVADANSLGQLLRGEIAFYEAEKRYVRKDGGPIWVLLNVTLLRDAGGHPARTMAVIQDITERKQAEARLRASEEFARTVLEASPDCLKIIGADGRLEFVNHNGACLLELDDRSDVIGQPWENIWPETFRPKIGESNEAARAGQLIQFTAEAPTAKGTPKHWDVRIAAIPSHDGQPVRLLAVSRDVTERKQAEIKLRESEARYRTAIRAGGLATWETDIESGQRRWSPEGMAIFGLDLADGIGRIGGDGDELNSRVHPDDRHLHDRYDIDLRETGSIKAQYRIVLPNGDIRWIAGGGMVLTRDPAGDPVRSVHIAADITARKQVEEKLREREHFLNRLTQVTPSIIVVFDLVEQRPVFMNRSAASFLGYSPEEITAMGGNIAATLMHPDDLARFPAQLDRVRALRGDETTDFEFRMRARSGEWRWLLSREGVFARDAAGAVYQSIGSTFDITERKQAEARLRESEFRLAAALHAGELGVHDHDLITGQIIWDETVRRIWGVSAGETITPGTFDAGVHPDDLPGVEAELAAAFDPSGSGHYKADYRVVGRDGITRWVRADGDVTFEHRVPVRLVGTARDISELKRNEQALRESESRFWAAFENSSLPMSIVAQSDGIYRHVNRACAELFGFKREQLIGRSPQELEFYAEPDQRRLLRSLFERDGYVHDFEVQWRANDGKLCTHLLNADPISLQGEPCLYAVSHDITQRKEAEAALHASESRFRGTFENAAIGVAHVALDGEWLSVNDKLCSIVGYSREELLTKTLQDITHPDDLDTDLGHVRQMLSGEISIYTMDKRYIRKDSSVVWAGLTVSLQRRDSGEPDYFISLVRDISERVHATEALRESEARYRALAEASDTIAWRTTPSGGVVFASNLWNTLTGQTEQEKAGWGWLDALHPDDRTPTIEKWHVSLESRTLHTNEFRIRVADGGYRWFSIRGVPIFNDDGTVREWMGANADIHDRKMAEQELRESEERYRAATAAMSDVLWTNTADGLMEGDQPGWGTFTGQSHDDYQGYGWLKSIHPEDAQPTIEAWTQAVVGKHTFKFEHRVRRHDGEWRMCSVRAVPVSNADGTIREWVGVHADIHDRKIAEQDLRESAARLTMALDAAKAGTWEAVPDRGEFVASEQALALHGLAPGTAMSQEKAMAFVLPEDRPRIEAEMRRTLKTGAPYRVELRTRPPDGSIRWLRSQAELRPDLEPGRLVGLVQDITEEKQREQQIQLLMGEVNHRSKNLLGVVMSVARQTGGRDNPEFVKRFGDRIQGLAASHDLLVHNEWQSVDLASLVRAQLSHFESLIGTRITIRGEAVSLSSAAAQTIGMALHELATNASKYGALADHKGKVGICWDVSGSADSPDRRFTFSWRESDGPPVVAPTRHGFGSTVTGKMVKMSLAGEVSAEYAPSGFVWQLNCQFEKLVA